MPRFRLVLLLACLVASACQAKPTTQAPVTVRAAVPSSAPRAATPSRPPAAAAPRLAHDGGIVYMAPLEAITDPGKKARAATLGTELAVGLRAERTMRDAELLAAAPAAFRLLEEDEPEADETPEPDDTPEPAGSPRPAGTPEPDDEDEDDEAKAEDDDEADEDDDEDDEHDEEKAEEAAKEAWKQLSGEQRELIKKALEGREAKVLAKLASKLERKKKAYAKQGTDAVVATADGGKDVTSTFTVSNAEGSRTVTVVRKFDATGLLVQSVQTLSGTSGGASYQAERSRTVNADGSLTIVSDLTITLAGQARTIRWEKAVAPDGTLTATGTLTRPDGTVVQLRSSGTEDGTETIAGSDAGVAITLTADVASGSATATVEAGEAGMATLRLDADDEDDDEGEVDDDHDEDEDDDKDEDDGEDEDEDGDDEDDR